MTASIIPMIAVLGLIALVLIAFVREWAPPEVIAMSAFCALVLSGVLSMEEAYDVFSNPAPITIAAMFILSAALEKSGGIEMIVRAVGKVVSRRLWVTIPVLMVLVAFFSAFMNNTPIVAIFLPVILAICRRRNIAASKLLIPLSYAAVMGGCCTLIGTSTNILVSGIASDFGMEPLGMFDFAPFGLVICVVGIFYVWIFGPWLLPNRTSLTASLSEHQREHFLCHLLVRPNSSLVGNRLIETELVTDGVGFQIIEVRRGGERLVQALREIEVKPFDRILVAISSKHMIKTESGEKVPEPEILTRLGMDNLSMIKGAVVEGVVAPHSRLIGQSLWSSRFRQAYGMLVLAVHRSGKNLSEGFQKVPLEFGDILLLLGPNSTFRQMRHEGDFMLMEDQPASKPNKGKIAVTLGLMGGVIVVASLNILPIVFAATLACVALLWMKCLTSEEAFRAVDWSILFMLYGMLAVGTAMETSGAAGWISESMVALTQDWIPKAWLPFIILSLFYLMGSMLTEVLSNNATAVVLAPIAINTALSLGLDPHPFIFAVAFSASAAFSTPIGYQTHMMVYGPGGYKFTDFLKFGLPLNLLLWITSSFFIPLFWPF